MDRVLFNKIVKEKKYIDVSLGILDYMNESSYEARKITFKINNELHTPVELIELFSKLTCEEVDSSFRIFPPFYTDYGKNIHLGKNVFINAGCSFQDQGGIFIGNNVLIGHNVVMATLNHDIDPNKRQNMSALPIIIEDNVWIGANATILQGVKICKNSIVGACSLVNKDVPENVVVAGIPAKIIKYIK